MIRDVLDRVLHALNIARGVESHFADTEGARLHYYVHGEAHGREPILLLHGLGDSATTWTRILGVLARSRRIYALDLGGHGLSTVSALRPYYTLREQVGLVEAFAAKVLPPRFLLAGQSLGGWIALHYALLHPARVSRLILINNAGIRAPILEQHREEYREMWRPTTKKEMRELWESMWAKPPWLTRLFAGEGLERVQSDVVQGFLDSLTPSDFLNEELANLVPETVVIWGRGDRLIPIESVDVMKERIPRVRVRFLEDCGHIPQAECPAALTEALLDAVETGLAARWKGEA